jgi:hypothetical protein
MKKNLFTAVLLMCTSSVFAHFYCLLDLSDDSIVYNENEVWTGVYNNESFEADGFTFSHAAPYGPGYYEGFLPSRNTDTANHYDSPGWIANQWGCMAKGGVNLESKDSYRADAIEGKPFIINYYSSYSSNGSEYGTSYITMKDTDGHTFSPEGVYVCNSPWGYYGCTEGDGFARPLTQEGDYYKVTFHGVNIKSGTTTSVDFYLAEYLHSDRNADGVINEQDNYVNDHWSWCDLRPLGSVDVIYITMDSSDKGDYGMNTSTIVCLDGLSATYCTSVESVSGNSCSVYATNGMICTQLDKAQTLSVYNTAGALVATYQVSAGTRMVDASHLAHGIYMVRYESGTAKVVL